MIQKPFTRPTTYITCPGCEKSEHGVSHLAVGTRTLWYCDECGARFHVHVLAPDRVSCEVDPRERKERTLVTLHSDKPVTLVVEGMRFIQEGGADDQEGRDRYYYDEHTCPTNYLPRVVAVIDEDGNKDPHGIFAYVKTEPWRNMEADEAPSK